MAKRPNSKSSYLPRLILMRVLHREMIYIRNVSITTPEMIKSIISTHTLFMPES